MHVLCSSRQSCPDRYSPLLHTLHPGGVPVVEAARRLESRRPQSRLGRGASTAAAGLSLFVGGVVTLTTSIWAGPSHTFDGYNLVNVLQLPLWIGGGAMVLAGLGLLARIGAEATGKSIEREASSQLGAV